MQVQYGFNAASNSADQEGLDLLKSLVDRCLCVVPENRPNACVLQQELFDFMKSKGWSDSMADVSAPAPLPLLADRFQRQDLARLTLPESSQGSQIPTFSLFGQAVAASQNQHAS